MKYAERQTRSMLMSLFQEHGFHPRTDLGQNFLIDLNLIEFILESAELCRDDVVLEIGAGTGGLTTALASRAGAVVSVEVDHRVFALAQQVVAHLSNVTLLNCDALKNKNHFSQTVLDAIGAQLAVSQHRRLKLVANLPYCIATPVISNLVASEIPWEAMIVTIQLELADRIRSKPSSEHYGALSIWLQSQCRVKVLKKLGPTVFWPRPQVDSAILQVLPFPEGREQIGDREFFHDFVRRLFQQRRKYLRSVLAGMYRQELSKTEIDEVLEPFEFKEGVRADALDVETIVKLGEAMRKRLVEKP
ncbi:MAG TPA: 16S rRNA (adenine(1518)-N(6)/adenine(1519)-N(6))-dimethyltransferase RsmA [Planctomycetaceae bacterium]|jgi:16S rRNA (adenine1518-N6/adenine1519-N6)-dimethyltransferase